jgi:hypothetical protein
MGFRQFFYVETKSPKTSGTRFGFAHVIRHPATSSKENGNGNGEGDSGSDGGGDGGGGGE